MKKVLITASGSLAKRFISRVNEMHSNDIIYDIVYYDDDIIPNNDLLHCNFYKFDPTSASKLSTIFSKQHVLAVIVMQEQLDATQVYKNLRLLKHTLPISLVDPWNLTLKDENLTLINSDELLTNRLISNLPDIPVIAQHVGLGVGEILEVLVPFGSSYAYRHISNVEQKSWKVAALYRNQQLLLPKPALMIRPNDLLVIVGQPQILKDVYKAIKVEQGQFPAPFGKNIVHIIDMNSSDYETSLAEIKKTLYLHKRLANVFLFIKIINPNTYSIVDYARSIDVKNVSIDIVYHPVNLKTDLLKEIKNYNPGVIVMNHKAFAKKAIRKALFETKKPILKLGTKRLRDLDKSAVVLSDNSSYENISSSIFDLSSQLQLKVNLFNVDKEESAQVDIIEYFENLANIYSKELILNQNHNNPIRTLQHVENFLQFIPFEKQIVNASIIDIIFPNVDRLYYMLDDYNQIFIPVL
jgi:hypothetical protein